MGERLRAHHYTLHSTASITRCAKPVRQSRNTRGSKVVCGSFLAKVSFLRRKTNSTQAPGLDTPRCVTLGVQYIPCATSARATFFLCRSAEEQAGSEQRSPSELLEAGTAQDPVNTPPAAALEASTAALEASTAVLEADPPVTSAREPREVPDITL